MREAVEETIDCLGSAIAFRIAEGSGIAVPLWSAGKLALYLAMIERGVNNSELARRLGAKRSCGSSR